MRIRHIDNDMLDTSTGQLAAQTDDIADAHSAGSKIYLVQARFLDLSVVAAKLLAVLFQHRQLATNFFWFEH